MTAKHSTKNITHLREILFRQLERLGDIDQTIDLDRVRLVNETSRLIIDTAKVEVAHAAVIQGAITLPFIESQDGSDERPHQGLPQSPAPEGGKASAEDRTVKALNSGPAEDHPWRGLGSRVHRMEH